MLLQASDAGARAAGPVVMMRRRLDVDAAPAGSLRLSLVVGLVRAISRRDWRLTRAFHVSTTGRAARKTGATLCASPSPSSRAMALDR